MRIVCTLILSCALLAGCSIPTHHMRVQHANTLAQSANMHKRTLTGKRFDLTTYLRISNPNDHTANVYIEGDGLAWITRKRISSNPTPTNPVALKLATLDPHTNVIYLARPCQYSKMHNPSERCSNKYWSSHRFAPEVIAATNDVLNQIKQQYGIQRFNLIGFSGGAAIALLVTAERNDIVSIRTVGGNVDHDKVNEIHNVSPMPESLNPRDIAEKINHIPQLHVVGEDDQIITPEVVESYLNAVKDTRCIQTKIIENVSHEKGWKERWVEIVKQAPDCKA